MFNLATQAQAIVTRLEDSGVFGTVGYIDQDDQALRQPVTLPGAFVLLEKIEPAGGRSVGTSLAPLGWSVVIRAKKLGGADGCLVLIDAVLDLLTGFRAAAGVKPLEVGKAEYFGAKGETVAYVVRFSASAAGESNTRPCS